MLHFQLDTRLSSQNERRLFEDNKFYHSDGKAKFLYSDPAPVAEPATAEYPFILLTGRGSSAQWHTQTRTKKSAILRKLYPESIYIEIHPADAERLHIRANQLITVSSKRAKVEATAYISRSVQAGQLFMPTHYAKANRLTIASFDPHSRQPSYKHCAVSVGI